MGSAGGKVILCGEHAVVHGGDAIVLGLDAGVTATAINSKSWRLIIGANELRDDEPSVEALRQLGAYLDSAPACVTLTIAMPLGVGLGGSAAMAVAIARALGELRDTAVDDARAFAAAQVWERVFHGNPSGVDAAAATYGGCLLYNRRGFAEAGEARNEPRRLAIRTTLHIALGVAGPPSLTKAMVERVAEHRRRDGRAFEQTLLELQAVVDQSRSCLESGELTHLGALLSRNHALLRQWELSTPDIERARDLALAAGALGAKLTGAGGGGCVLALCTEQTMPTVLGAWEASGHQTLSAHITPSPLDGDARPERPTTNSP